MINIADMRSEIICVILNLVIIIKMYKDRDEQITARYMMRQAGFVLYASVFSLIAYVLKEKNCFANDTVEFILSVILMLCFVFAAYYWFMYSESIQKSSFVISDAKRKRVALLLYIFIGTCFAVFLSNLLFLKDDGFEKSKVVLEILQMIVCVTYIGLTGLRALVKSMNKRNYLKMREYRTIYVYGLIVLAGYLAHFITGQNYTSMGLTIAMVITYIYMQDTKISIDPLTKLNNKRQLYSYLSHQMKGGNDAEALYLLMMDGDRFKTINDKYGHIEGDEALVYIAEALRQAAKGKKSFSARYGGDEFVMVCPNSSESQVIEMIDKIRSELEKIRIKKNLPYQLGVSVGYTKYSKYMKTPQEFIQRADQELYREKQLRRKQYSVWTEEWGGRR